MTVTSEQAAYDQQVGALSYYATVRGDEEARRELARLRQQGPPTAPQSATAAPTPAPTPAPTAEHADDLETQQRRRAMQLYNLGPEMECLLLGVDNPAELLEHAERIALRFGTAAPPTPAFAPTTGQQVGNAGPPGPAKGTREWGEQQCREWQQRQRPTWLA